MSTAKLAPVFLAMKTGWEKKDWRACADLFHPDGVLHSVMLAPCVGWKAFINALRPVKNRTSRCVCISNA